MSHIIFNTSACFSTYSTYSVVSFHLSPSCIFSVSLTFCLIQSNMTFFVFRLIFLLLFSKPDMKWQEKRNLYILSKQSSTKEGDDIFSSLSDHLSRALVVCVGFTLLGWVLAMLPAIMWGKDKWREERIKRQTPNPLWTNQTEECHLVFSNLHLSSSGFGQSVLIGFIIFNVLAKNIIKYFLN